MARRWNRAMLITGLSLVALAVPTGFVLAGRSPAEGTPTRSDSAGPSLSAGPATAATAATVGTASPTVTAPAHSGAPKPAPAAKPAGPNPPSGARPTGANTGVPNGVALRVVTGDQTYSTAGQVISGLDIHGFVTITAKNVVLKDSIIRGGQPTCNSAVIQVEDSGSATIVDSEIAPAHPSPCLDGIWATNVTLLRLDIHGAVDGVKAFDNTTLRDSYIHDLSSFANDPNQGGGPTHNDAVQTFVGNRHIFLQHNSLVVGTDANAAYQVSQDGGQPATDIHIENNWLDGGGCTLNFSHGGGPTPMTGIFVLGNRFGRHSYFDCPILVSTRTTLSQLTGNVWDDTGSPIPTPQRHD